MVKTVMLLTVVSITVALLIGCGVINEAKPELFRLCLRFRHQPVIWHGSMTNVANLLLYWIEFYKVININKKEEVCR